MQRIVKVTRRGQTTIPYELRVKHGIEEGDEILIEEGEGGLVIKIIPRLEKLAGVDTKYGMVEEVKREVEKLREDY
ncbi:MAG: AbrB/MazE/SpoVT family DNA-binding domain-containing protein [Thaumarchaeota archaeon]|nr:AbrB/MazE/SpoVT family DNA-binding domain-containing protein [Nitrososphaerota archaeon]